MKQLSKDFSVTATDGGNNIVIQLQGQGGDVPILQPLENAASIADPQHPLENVADGQVGARNAAIPQNPPILESPLFP